SLASLGRFHLRHGRAMPAARRLAEARAANERLAAEYPHIADAHYYPALFLATCPDESLRDPAAAVRLAHKGDALICGIEGMCMGALGIAQYRLGDDRAAVASLELAPRLRDHPHPEQLFYRAAARWRLGRKDTARRDYDEAVRLMAFYDD